MYPSPLGVQAQPCLDPAAQTYPYLAWWINHDDWVEDGVELRDGGVGIARIQPACAVELDVGRDSHADDDIRGIGSRFADLGTLGVVGMKSTTILEDSTLHSVH